MVEKSKPDNKHKPLRLKAEDPKDLKVISALLQDAIIHTGGMQYSPDAHLFTVLANRFVWEAEPEEVEGEKLHKRTHSGVHFSNVTRVRHSGIDRSQPDQLHNLLAVHGDKDGEIHLIFSDGEQVCLHVDQILAHLTDLHENWWTHQKPEHPKD
jgi:hypothetical protein